MDSVTALLSCRLRQLFLVFWSATDHEDERMNEESISGINLATNDGRNQYIAVPSGKKIGLKDLEVGRYYLQDGGWYKYRLIHRIDDVGVFYDDGISFAYCSPQHFVRRCPYEATPEEVEF